MGMPNEATGCHTKCARLAGLPRLDPRNRGPIEAASWSEVLTAIDSPNVACRLHIEEPRENDYAYSLDRYRTRARRNGQCDANSTRETGALGDVLQRAQ